MPTPIATFRDKVIPRIQDDAGKLTITPDVTCDVDRAIASALGLYSKDRPREIAKDIAGSGAFDYLLTVALFPSWSEGFSRVIEVAFPYSATTREPPVLIEGLDWREVVLDANARYLRFLSSTPTATQHMLVTHTAPHQLDGTVTTIPAGDEEALADLAAAACCDQLAAVYSQSTNASISADSVNQISKAAEYRALARVYRDRYAEKIGKPKDGAPAAAAATVQVSRGFGTITRDDYFVHSQRVR